MKQMTPRLDSLELSRLHDEDRLDALEADQHHQDSDFAAAIQAEAVARAQADTALGSALATETSTRASQNSTLTNTLAAETTARTQADTAEVTARNSAITAAVATEATARTTADTTEATARANGDTTNATAISNEATTRASADAAEITARNSAISSAVASESALRTTADNSLQTQISAITSRTQNKRASIGAMLLGATQNIAFTWATPFADTNYNVLYSVEGTIALLGGVTVRGVSAKTVNGCTVTVQAGAVLVAGATLAVTAIHD